MYPDKAQLNADAWIKDFDAMSTANEAAAERPFNNPKKHQAILDENQREFNTRDIARENPSIQELRERKAAGEEIEISGDALARARAGKPGKWQTK